MKKEVRIIMKKKPLWNIIKGTETKFGFIKGGGGRERIIYVHMREK